MSPPTRRYIANYIVLNMATLDGANAVLHDLNPPTASSWLLPLTPPQTAKLGSGYSWADIHVEGRYDLISWIAYNDGHTPPGDSYTRTQDLSDAAVAFESPDDWFITARTNHASSANPQNAN